MCDIRENVFRLKDCSLKHSPILVNRYTRRRVVLWSSPSPLLVNLSRSQYILSSVTNRSCGGAVLQTTSTVEWFGNAIHRVIKASQLVFLAMTTGLRNHRPMGRRRYKRIPKISRRPRGATSPNTGAPTNRRAPSKRYFYHPARTCPMTCTHETHPETKQSTNNSFTTPTDNGGIYLWQRRHGD